MIEDTETENCDDDLIADSVRVSSKPSRLQFDDSLQMKKQTSMTPVHQATKSFVHNDKKLIIQIEGIDQSESKCTSSDHSGKDDKPELNSVNSSVQVDEFVRTPKVQSLIHQIVRLKAGRWHKHQN